MFCTNNSICLVQVLGEHHNLTINSSDCVSIDRAARLHASASSFCSYIFMHVREKNKRTSTRTWLASPMIDAAVLVYERGARLLCTGLCLVPVLGEHHISLINTSTVIASPSIVLLVHVRLFLALLVRPHACTIQLLRLHRVPQPRRKPSWGKNKKLAGVPDNRYNCSAGIRTECVIVPSWPLHGTSSQVNITTLANSDFPGPSGGDCC